MSAVLV